MIFEKNVFFGVKREDPEQNRDLETRQKTCRESPKHTIQCKNPQG